MSSCPPTALGIDLLGEAEMDPQGWPWMDVIKLIEECGYTQVLPTQDLTGYHLRRNPHLANSRSISVRQAMEVSPQHVVNICRQIREDLRRGQEEHESSTEGDPSG